MKHDEYILNQLIKNIDINFCLGNLDLVKNVARRYAEVMVTDNIKLESPSLPVNVVVRLRELLWIRHGCGIEYLYGDDGEMQCNKCMIDFKRDTPEQIMERFRKINEPYIADALKKLGLAT